MCFVKDRTFVLSAAIDQKDIQEIQNDVYKFLFRGIQEGLLL